MLLQKAVRDNAINEMKERFEDIKSGKNIALKQARLSVLQKDLEEVFQIPLAGDVLKYRKDNPEIMELYSDVVEARDAR